MRKVSEVKILQGYRLELGFEPISQKGMVRKGIGVGDLLCKEVLWPAVHLP